MTPPSGVTSAVL